MTDVSSIPHPHGGKLINRFASTTKNIDGMSSIEVNNDLRNDIENIADGIFSPLEGFPGQDDFQSIVKSGRLTNGLAWTIPIIMDVDDQTATKMKDAGEVMLRTGNEHFGIIGVEETYSYDKTSVAKAIYQTNDLRHPGVMKVIGLKNRLIGGKIEVFKRIPQSPLRKFRMIPLKLDQKFRKEDGKLWLDSKQETYPILLMKCCKRSP